MFRQCRPSLEDNQHFKGNTLQVWHAYVVLKGFETSVCLKQVVLKSKQYLFQLI
jgi:hypothetical protein